MPTITDTKPQISLPTTDSAMSYSDSIRGVALFDLNGLPKEYFTTSDESSMSWVQTIFQALGLRSLLMSSLQLEGFRHATILGEKCSSVVVKKKDCYIAVLVQIENEAITDALIQWVKNSQLKDLRQSSHICTA